MCVCVGEREIRCDLYSIMVIRGLFAAATLSGGAAFDKGVWGWRGGEEEPLETAFKRQLRRASGNFKVGEQDLLKPACLKVYYHA